MRARNVTICALKGRLTPRVVPSISFYLGIVRRRQYCTTFLKMRGRDASLVEPMSFGMSALAIGSAHCPHAPPGTNLVASTLVSIKAQLPPLEIYVQYQSVHENGPECLERGRGAASQKASF
ncbi:uncharacterized protein BO87DRAFT_364803 [Aspergillus neoniger CBS 115656]|uniref:Uncharacterized protein n=1 Tax=Aspergillus neoniger (strain CBS 115656) TaxID=1448310 RepID=A0A318YF80_ASPNB|nr:hypothetical protein BO87DRAFT_364803 [Aspergillus neoniger CBS 115656]PYH31340.1 hypothetical protein BO87DRAFT_364803 [Aspergillus neoniger CBS 115656]